VGQTRSLEDGSYAIEYVSRRATVISRGFTEIVVRVFRDDSEQSLGEARARIHPGAGPRSTVS
jgi:hypothetical protein